MTTRVSQLIKNGIHYTTMWLDVGGANPTVWTNGTGSRHYTGGTWNNDMSLAGHKLLGVSASISIAGADHLLIELDFPAPDALSTLRLPYSGPGAQLYGMDLDASYSGSRFFTFTSPEQGFEISGFGIIPGAVRMILTPTYASGNGPTVNRLDLVTQSPTFAM